MRSISDQFRDALEANKGFEARSKDYGEAINTCQDCPAPKENGQSFPQVDGKPGPLNPLKWCKNYCAVAQHPMPDGYFEWIYECYTLLGVGYTIENNQLTWTEWKDVATMKSLLESRQSSQQTESLGSTLVHVLKMLQRR